MNVMLDDDGILTAVQSEPEACEEFWWGKRLGAVAVSLDRARADMLADAWEGRAPRRLTKDRTGGTAGGPPR